MLKSILYNTLKVLFTAVLVYFIYSKLKNIDFSAVPYSNLSLSIVPVLILYFISKFFSMQRLWEVQKLHTLSTPYSYHLRIYLLGMFYNIFLPGGIGGDTYKAYRMNKDFNSSLKLIGTILLVDRGIGFMSILVHLLAIYLLNLEYSLLILLGGVATYISYFLFLQRLSFTSPLIEICSLLSQAFQIGIVYLLMYSLQIDLNESGYVLLFLLSSIAGMLPLSIGGLGIRESVMLAGAPILHLSLEYAVLIGFLFYLITLLSSIPGFILHLYNHFINLKNYAGNY
jgi:uncharacterized membrane protein YbhN (UPF0104 family)